MAASDAEASGPHGDFAFGAERPRREVIWYETYSSRLTPSVRHILQRAFGHASNSKSVRIVYRSIPPDAEAELRARAAIAAGWQGRFPELHDAVTGHDVPKDRDTLIGMARKLDLDIELFTRDLDSERTDERLAQDRAAAARAGHGGGPLLVINGRPYKGPLDESSLIDALEQPLGLRLEMAGRDFFHNAASGGLVLIFATLAALLIANTGADAVYEGLRDSVLVLGWNDATFGLSVEGWVNDGLMTIFFLIVGIEIKREIVAGELSDPARAALPIAAAIGGMAVPAAIYAALNWDGAATHGWGVPMATDIAFALGILALLGRRVPASLRVFLSALAIADDLGAIVVIALFYSEGINLAALLWAGAIFAAMLGLNRVRVYALWPYVLLGAVLWAALHEAGIHATIAGVLTAMAIPSRPHPSTHGIAAQTTAVLDAESRSRSDGFSQEAVERLNDILGRLREPGEHLRIALESWTSFLILPLFAFFNTGLALSGSGFDPFAASSLGVIAGLVLGKPLGILAAAWLVLKLGVARKSDEIGWLHLAGAGALGGIGFTMSIFIATSAFEGDALTDVKLATLIASTISAVAGTLILRAAAARSAAAQDLR